MQNWKLVLVGIVLFVGGHSRAQDTVALQYGNLITEEDLRDNLTIIASDAMEGRETGKRGQKMAAAFIRAHFEELGLLGPVDGDYYQKFELYSTRPGDSYVRIGDKKINGFTDVAFYGDKDSGGEISAPAVFGGNGTTRALQNVDFKGKAVILVTNDGFPATERTDSIYSAGARIILVSHAKSKADFDILANQIKSLGGRRDLALQRPVLETKMPDVFVVAPNVTETLLGVSRETLLDVMKKGYKKNALKKLKPATITYKTTPNFKPVKTENVLGYLEGTDKKDELLVVTAHYDHVGVKSEGPGDRIHNGADDDGSGTVAVMQMAKVFAQAKAQGKGPRRSILFMLVTGEEKGLLGSDYYTQHPVFPLENTVVNLNIDMIGRRDPQHANSAPYVYVIGADKLSSELNRLSETTNELYTKLLFDYTYNDMNHPDRLYYRSDHWNFAKKNIPIIFYFDGIHEDYHKPSDEVDKIEFDLLLKRTQCIFYTAWEIVNRDQRIMPDEKKTN
jgi:hypothetical protein